MNCIIRFEFKPIYLGFIVLILIQIDQSCYVKIEFKNVHDILEPIVDKVEHIVEEVEEVADKVEEVVEKVVEKVEGSDKGGEVVDKVDDVVTKVERVVENFNEIIQMREASKVEGKLINSNKIDRKLAENVLNCTL